MRRIPALAAVLISLCGFGAAQALTIVEESLPQLSTGVELHVYLHATGGAPPYHWSATNGKLPEGITLTHDGLLEGRPTKAGDTPIDITVTDSSHPAHIAEREFHTPVSAALTLNWLHPPKVQDNRIDGAVEVSNGTRDPFDLTVVIVAVATLDNRATTIGYQHFELKPGADEVRINFGNTLPRGGYVIHADAVAEIPRKNQILRQRLETPQPLQIAIGP